MCFANKEAVVNHWTASTDFNPCIQSIICLSTKTLHSVWLVKPPPLWPFDRLDVRWLVNSKQVAAADINHKGIASSGHCACIDHSFTKIRQGPPFLSQRRFVGLSLLQLENGKTQTSWRQQLHRCNGAVWVASNIRWAKTRYKSQYCCRLQGCCCWRLWTSCQLLEQAESENRQQRASRLSTEWQCKPDVIFGVV